MWISKKIRDNSQCIFNSRRGEYVKKQAHFFLKKKIGSYIVIFQMYNIRGSAIIGPWWITMRIPQKFNKTVHLIWTVIELMEFVVVIMLTLDRLWHRF